MSSLVSLLACACVADAGGQPPAAPGAAGLGLDEVVLAARADAARRTGWAAESLALIGADSVTWADGSLGCPQPGMAYTQALVPGYRVRLRGPAGELDYHASARGALVLCPPGRAVDPLPGASRI
ncbi:MAG: hypothetical protein IH627_24125 [Rubrivivax sp.]|nr:hypothetical protein [Rubrivivax sp.]